MSELRRPSVTNEHQSLADRFESGGERAGPNYRKIAFLGGAGLALSGVAAAAMFGVFGAEKDEHRTPERPASSAPAAPGETTPSPEASETTPELTPEMATYILDGKEMNYEEYIEANRIPSSLEGKQAVTQLFSETLTNWVQSGLTKEDAKRYKDYESPVDENGSWQTGLYGATQTFYDRGFEEAVIGQGDDLRDNLAGKDSSPLIEEMAFVHRHSVASYEKTMNEPTPFKGKFEVLGFAHVSEIDLHGNHETPFSVYVKYSDNGSENSAGPGYTPLEAFGTKVFKADGALIENTETNSWKLAAVQLSELDEYEEQQYNPAQ